MKPKYQGWWLLIFFPGILSYNIKNTNDAFISLMVSLFVVDLFMFFSYLHYKKKLKNWEEENKNNKNEKKKM